MSVAQRYPKLSHRVRHRAAVLQADERAREHEGGYLASPEIRRAVKLQSLWLVASFAAFLGLTMLGLFVLRAVMG